ncbi:uncharacterized protein ig2599ANME_1624 [groundwater metagenome]
MVETGLVFKRTCNYWIDAGIVGLYDTLNKPLPNSETIGEWGKTIKSHSNIEVNLDSDQLSLRGEESQIDLALSYSLERIRTTLYDVSTEKQISSPEENGRIKIKSTIAGEVIASGKQAEYTYFRQEIIKNTGTKNIFLPIKQKKIQQLSTCVFCGQLTNENLALKKAEEVFIGLASRSSPFVEGESSNRCFHSYHKGCKKCWQCGYLTFFAPLLLFYRRITIDRDKKDTYYILPYVSGNLSATNLLYRSLSGKRGLARALGTDLSEKNYMSSFGVVPRGIPALTLSFYFDLFDRLLPKSSARLLQTSQNIGLIDNRGSVFQTALFLIRDSGQKSFVMRETTIDRSAYFMKLYSYLNRYFDSEGDGRLLKTLNFLIERSSEWTIVNGQKFRRTQLQRLSVLKASQALTEGKHVYRYLLTVLSSDLREETAKPYDSDQITSLFQKYDQWLFNKENEFMSNIVKQAKDSGRYLSQDFWNNPSWDNEEKKNLIKRYYYSIERSPSPVKFLEQVRHAYKKIEKEIPIEMIFHTDDGSEDIKKFEVYRVYFLAGMLNGWINKSKSTLAVESPQTT